MPRYKLTIEYDGGSFYGWQRQNDEPTVQAVLEKAAFSLSGVETLVQGAGRTDSGVHALAQVAHLDFARDYPVDTVRDALNYHVRPHPVSVLAVEIAPDDFHARFSATGRAYLYRILNRRSPPAVDSGRVWWVATPLDAGIMHGAPHGLLAQHHFSTFRAADCQANSPVLTLDIAKDGVAVRLFSTITTLGEPQDLALHDIRIESFFPADDASRAVLEALA